MAKALIVLTNHEKLGETGNKTGWYLPEVAHPYKVFTEAGVTVDFVSPKGGKAPLDPGSKEAFAKDEVCTKFLSDKVMKETENTKAPSDVKPGDYKIIFYAGGHGPMWDLPLKNNKEAEAVAKLAANIYEAGGIVAAVCHGTVGLLPVTLSNGDLLIKGKKITSFTNAEEEAVGLSNVMPFLLETRLKEDGADFVAGENWAVNVQVSDRVVTGQNPASATKTAEECVKILKK